jgi:hypothetical protein
MKDAFGNYVIQKMLDVLDDQSRELLISKIKPHVLTLRKFMHGKHIITYVILFIFIVIPFPVVYFVWYCFFFCSKCEKYGMVSSP